MTATPIPTLLIQLRQMRGQLLQVADRLSEHCQAGRLDPSVAGPAILELERAMHSIRNAEIKAGGAQKIAALSDAEAFRQAAIRG